MIQATDEEWRSGFAAYADNARRKRGECVGTFDQCMASPIAKASIACLILEIRTRRARHSAAQTYASRTAPASAPHKLGRDQKKPVRLDGKMLAAGERDDDF